jgi:hypothetical protein
MAAERAPAGAKPRLAPLEELSEQLVDLVIGFGQRLRRSLAGHDFVDGRTGISASLPTSSSANPADAANQRHSLEDDQLSLLHVSQWSWIGFGASGWRACRNRTFATEPGCPT